MEQKLFIYNTLSRRKELFEPLHAPNVGMYVCGPTVYGDPHLGHARPAITFDLLFRYLKHLGYKVRYVRNITDVGHLEHDADDGDDKIAKKARLEQLEPMEVAQYYTNRYHAAMDALNVLPPSIEPHATGHIIEQEELVKQIMDNGFAYESNGSIYFDIAKFNEKHHYGVLSGRNLDDIINASRQLDGVGEKHNQADFALWKKAQPEHIMRWPSPWSEGFPGWHCECTAMGRKYLGSHFDIHGGGLDLRFPHHENEMAQTCAAGYPSAARWMHSAWVTAKGEKMSKSLGTGLSVPSVLAEHSAWVVRYALGSVQYRSMLEWSDQALVEAQAAYDRVSNFIERAGVALGGQPSREEVAAVSADDLPADFVAAMNDDVNVSGATAAIFTAIRSGNTLLSQLADRADSETAKAEVREALLAVRAMLDTLGLDPLAEPWVSAGGAADGPAESPEHAALEALIAEQLNARAEARKAKDFAKADQIRDALTEAGIAIEDGPQGSTWSLK